MPKNLILSAVKLIVLEPAAAVMAIVLVTSIFEYKSNELEKDLSDV